MINGRFLNSCEYVLGAGTTSRIVMAGDKTQDIGSLIHVGSFTLTLEFTNHFDNTVWGYVQWIMDLRLDPSKAISGMKYAL